MRSATEPEAGLPSAYQFARWDGTQDPAPFSPDDLFDALAEQLLTGGDLALALRRLLERGAGQTGLAELLDRLERAGPPDGAADDVARLLARLRGAAGPDDLSADDAALTAALLGQEAGQALERLRDLTGRLRRAGYLADGPEGPELTARAIRRIGQGALAQLFGRLDAGRPGRHAVPRPGPGAGRSDESGPYRFGDPFLLALEPTVLAAVRRSGRGTPVRLAAADFVVHRPERGVRCATVLLVDASRSMLLRGCHVAAKQVALALEALIRSRFPDDAFHLVGFADQARVLTTEALVRLDYRRSGDGTNLQHALAVARGLLARHPSMARQVLLVTDGEPTAWIEDGRLRLAYPPTFQTLRETLREVGRCTRDGVRINTFMLERRPYLVEFVERMARINRGRAFMADPERLGEYVLVDFLSHRREMVR